MTKQEATELHDAAVIHLTAVVEVREQLRDVEEGLEITIDKLKRIINPPWKCPKCGYTLIPWPACKRPYRCPNDATKLEEQ